MHQKTILWGYVVDIVGHSQQYYLSGKPKTCLTSKHSRCQVLGQKCTSLFARCICTGRPPSPFPPLRHTSSWPGCLIFTASGCDRSTSCSVEPPPACWWTIGYSAKKDRSNKKQRSKGHRFYVLKTSLLKGFLGRAADRGGSKAAEDTTVWAAQRDTAK